MGERLSASQEHPDPSVVERAAGVLRAGGVIVTPTDSVYGLACAAVPGNPAHRRIFEMKRRDATQTLPWFVADAADLSRYGDDVPAWAHALARAFWPGALTLVVRASRAVPPEYARPGAAPGAPATIALRVPASALVRELVRAAGAPLAQTSANTHGRPSATSGSAVEPSLAAAADLLIDAGSTIVDATGEAPRILREGAVTARQVLLATRPGRAGLPGRGGASGSC